MKFEVTSNINVSKNLEKVRDKAFWLQAATDWHRLYGKFVPRDTGTLEETVTIAADKLWGQIEHTVPYAHRMYVNNYNFRKDQNPLACSHWDQAAKPTQEPKLIKAMQEHVESGRLNLGKT